MANAHTGNSDKDDPILDRTETARVRKISPSTLDRMVRQGLFPPPIRLSARRLGWKQSVALNYSVDPHTAGAAA